MSNVKTFIFGLLIFFSSISMELPPSRVASLAQLCLKKLGKWPPKIPSLAQLCCKKIGEYPQENADNLFAHAGLIEDFLPENRSSLAQELIATIDPSPELLATIPLCYRVKFSPDGKKIAALRNGLTIYDADTGKELKRLSSDDGYFRIKWSPGSRYIVAKKSGINLNSKIGIWETDNEKPLSIFEIIVGGKYTFSAYDQLFFIQNRFKDILDIYDVKNMNHLRSLLSGGSKVPFQDPLGRYITAVSGKKTSFYDAQTFEEKKQISGVIQTFSSDGEFFCASDESVTHLYNVTNFEHIKDFPNHFLEFYKLIVPNRYFIRASSDKDSLFDVKTGSIIASCKHDYPDSCNNAYISLDGTKIIELNYDPEKNATVINIKKNNNELLHRISINTQAIRVSFSWDKKHCIVGYCFTTALINIVTGKLIASYDTLFKRSLLKPSALFSSDGKYLIPKNNKTEIWKLPPEFDSQTTPLAEIVNYIKKMNRN